MKKLLLFFLLLLLCSINYSSAQTKIKVSGDTLTLKLGYVSFKMIKVEAGSFVMGDVNSNEDCEDERQIHKVTITKDYYIAETEVTQQLWLEVMYGNPSMFKNCEQCPIENVSWTECVSFIEKLNEYTGMFFRMPTEAEWEYAARGGNKSKGYRYSGSDLINSVGWYNSHFGSRPVKGKNPNELNLYDMTGNVWEFCSDWYDRNYGRKPVVDPKGPETGRQRVSRGGGWFNKDTLQCRVSYRNPCDPSLRGNGLGLRLVLDDTSMVKVRTYKLKYDVIGCDNQNFAVCYYDGSKAYNLRSFPYCSFDTLLNAKMSPASFAIATMYESGGKRKIGLFSTMDGSLFGTLNADTISQPVDFCFTSDSRNVAVLYDDKTVSIYDFSKRSLLRTISLQSMADRVTVSDNNYFIALSGGDKVYIYNYETGVERTTFTLGKKINDIQFSADNSKFAVLTEDGIMRLYETRTFSLIQTITGLGSAVKCKFHPDGKYVSVITSQHRISIINLKETDDRQFIDVVDDDLYHIGYAISFDKVVYLVYCTDKNIVVRALDNLVPNYYNIVSERVNEQMIDWQKQQKDESFDEYLIRVDDNTRNEKYQQFQNEIATELAESIIDKSNVTIGGYDTKQQTLEIQLDIVSIHLNVQKSDATQFVDAGDLIFENSVYTVDDKDNFELLYTEVTNRKTGKKYIYDNNKKHSPDISEEESFVPLAIVRQTSIDEIKLESIKEEIVNQAMDSNLISDKTHINVRTFAESTTDADGKRIMNYNIDFNYYVDQEFSTRDDYKPGQYVCTESEAAMAMLKIVGRALADQFSSYLVGGKKVVVTLYGSADATPINRVIKYKGEYGNYTNEIVYENEELKSVTVAAATGISTNEQLAFLRAASVKCYLDNNFSELDKMNKDYIYRTTVSEESGSEYRRIGIRFTFVDVFQEQ